MHDKNELLKHTAAIHIANTLTLTQRKAANILHKHAWPALNEDKTHKISISEISVQLGWGPKSNTTDMLKEALLTLNKTQVEWNIFGKDKKTRWGVATILSGVEIEDGVLYYRYDKGLRDLLSAPTIYAKLNLFVQQAFRSKHGLALWEYLVEALCSAQVDTLKTHWIDLEKFRKMFSVTEPYYDTFAKLNQKVIKPAIEEVNNVSDIACSVEFKKEARKVIALCFTISRKNTYQPSLPLFASQIIDDNPGTDSGISTSLQQILTEEFKLSHKTARNIISKYEVDKVHEALDYVRSQKANIKDIARFTYSAIKEGWHSIVQENIAPSPALHCSDDDITDEEWKSVRQTLRNSLGDPTFISWIKKLKLISKNSEQVKLKAETKFISTWIDNNYKEMLLTAWKEHIPTLKELKVS